MSNLGQEVVHEIERFLSLPAGTRRDRSTELRIKNAKFRNPPPRRVPMDCQAAAGRSTSRRRREGDW